MKSARIKLRSDHTKKTSFTMKLLMKKRIKHEQNSVKKKLGKSMMDRRGWDPTMCEDSKSESNSEWLSFFSELIGAISSDFFCFSARLSLTKRATSVGPAPQVTVSDESYGRLRVLHRRKVAHQMKEEDQKKKTRNKNNTTDSFSLTELELPIHSLRHFFVGFLLSSWQRLQRRLEPSSLPKNR